jgi:hypothetical protein
VKSTEQGAKGSEGERTRREKDSEMKLKTMSNSSVSVAGEMVIDICLLCFAVVF